MVFNGKIPRINYNIDLNAISEAPDEMSEEMSGEVLLQIKRQPKITIPQIATALDVTTRTIERYLLAILLRKCSFFNMTVSTC